MKQHFVSIICSFQFNICCQGQFFLIFISKQEKQGNQQESTWLMERKNKITSVHSTLYSWKKAAVAPWREVLNCVEVFLSWDPREYLQQTELLIPLWLYDPPEMDTVNLIICLKLLRISPIVQYGQCLSNTLALIKRMHKVEQLLFLVDISPYNFAIFAYIRL